MDFPLLPVVVPLEVSPGAFLPPGNTATHQRFLARSASWRNVLDPETLVRPRRGLVEFELRSR